MIETDQGAKKKKKNTNYPLVIENDTDQFFYKKEKIASATPNEN